VVGWPRGWAGLRTGHSVNLAALIVPIVPLIVPIVSNSSYRPSGMSAFLLRPFLKKLPDFVLKGVLLNDPDVCLGDSLVAVNEQRHRQTGSQSKVLLKEVEVADDDWVADRVLYEIRLYKRPSFLIHRNADRSQSLAPVLLLELDIPGDFNLASCAPSRPEIQQDHLPLVVGQSNPCTLRVSQREIRGTVAGTGWRDASGHSDREDQRQCQEGHANDGSRDPTKEHL
jgi:hypothetical protein